MPEKQISTGQRMADSMPYALFAASQRTIQIDVKALRCMRYISAEFE
jgi:hypothetical protein